MYLFEKPLIRGTMLKRKSQFTALMNIDGEEITAHIPITNRIGDVENKNLSCLLSYHDDPKRKLKYDVEAVLLSDDDNLIGINQILSNRLVEHYFKVKECVAVPKSKKLLQFTLDDGTGTDRIILSGIHAFYEPEELVGKTLLAIVNLPARNMMGIDSCGMLMAAIHEGIRTWQQRIMDGFLRCVGRWG